jgi:Aerotolerance regulator N-terminal
MQFLNPIWLWGLTGLLIPIGIHLLSRKEGKTIRVGSIRHMEDSTTKQFKNLRLNEFLLLALRCLLIILLVFVLSDLVLNSINENKKWLLIENGLEGSEEFAVLMDTLEQNGFEIRSLTDGFPLLRDTLITEERPEYWTLVSALKAKDVDHAVVLSYNYINQFKGKRPSIPPNVRWISKNPAPKEFVLNTIQLSKDSIAQRHGETKANRTSFNEIRSALLGNQQSSSGSNSGDGIRQLDTISISIVYDPAFTNDKNIIKAAAHAIDKSIISVVTINEYTTSEFPLTNKTDWTIWLSDKVTSGLSGHVIRYCHTPIQAGLFKRDVDSTGSSSWILTSRIDVGKALRENLSVQLALILTHNEDEKRKAFDFDRRVLSDLLLWSEKPSAVTYKATIPTASGKKSFSIIFLVILLLERLVAFKRNQ